LRTTNKKQRKTNKTASANQPLSPNVREGELLQSSAQNPSTAIFFFYLICTYLFNSVRFLKWKQSPRSLESFFYRAWEMQSSKNGERARNRNSARLRSVWHCSYLAQSRTTSYVP